MHPVIEKVREIAKEKPDYFYKPPGGEISCKYCSSDTDPNQGCIIGRAILAIKPELKGYLLEIDEHSEIIRNLPHINSQFNLTKRELEWIALVQLNQDGAYSWSMAVAEADRVFPLEEKGS